MVPVSVTHKGLIAGCLAVTPQWCSGRVILRLDRPVCSVGHPEVSQFRDAGPFCCRPSTRASMGGSPTVLRCGLRLYEAVTGPAEVFHLNALPDVPPISPATQNWLAVPGWGAAAL